MYEILFTGLNKELFCFMSLKEDLSDGHKEGFYFCELLLKPCEKDEQGNTINISSMKFLGESLNQLIRIPEDKKLHDYLKYISADNIEE